MSSKLPKPETVESVVRELFQTAPETPAHERAAQLLHRFGELRAQARKEQRCPSCGRPIDLTQFRNEISQREYQLSGFCQQCQDRFFGVDP